MAANRYDVWMPSLGPSERLFRRRQAGQLSSAQYLREYRRELFMDGRLDLRNKSIKNHGQKFALRLIKTLARKGPVTLMCHCESDERCHRSVLKKVILSSQV